VTTDLDTLEPQIGAGDPEAFARWLAGAERPLRNSLRAFATHVDSEAVMQEALLRTWQVAPRFVADGKPDGLLRLAIRIARNLALDQVRAGRRLQPTDIETLERAAQTAAEIRGDLIDGPGDPLLRHAVEDCRRRLPRQPARALAARLATGGREPDCRSAERLGMRRNTFLQNITRARRLLAECLKQRGIDLAAELA
jgi:DNA-directed RNA polymerase specialized sigma24 family protein